MKHLSYILLIFALTFTSCNTDEDPVPITITDNPIIDTTGLNTDSSGNITVDTVTYTFPLGVLKADSVSIDGYPIEHKGLQNTYAVSINDYLIDQNIIAMDILQIFVTDESTDPFFLIDTRTTNDDVIVDLVCSRETYRSNTHQILTTIVTASTIYKITCTMDILSHQSAAFVRGMTLNALNTLTDPQGITRIQRQSWPLNSTSLSVHNYVFQHRYNFYADRGDGITYHIGGIPINEGGIIDFIILPNNRIVFTINNTNYIATIETSTSNTVYLNYQGNSFTLQY